MQDFVEALDVVAEALQKDDQQHPANSSKAVPPLDPTFGTLLQSIANAAAHDLRKLFVATMKPPVNQDDVKAICAECKNTSVMLVAHCTNALTHGTALHDAMLPLVEAYLNTTRAWVRALIQNNSIGTAASQQLMGRVEAAVKQLAAAPPNVGAALQRAMLSHSTLIEDGLAELAEEVKQSDEKLKRTPSLARPKQQQGPDTESSSSSRRVGRPSRAKKQLRSRRDGDDDGGSDADDEGDSSDDDDHSENDDDDAFAFGDDDDEDDFGETLWIGKQREIVYPAVAFIKAGMKLLQRMAAVVATLPEQRLLPHEAALLHVTNTFSPRVDDVVLALYEPEDLQGIRTACVALHDTVWEALELCVFQLLVEENDMPPSPPKQQAAKPAKQDQQHAAQEEDEATAVREEEAATPQSQEAPAQSGCTPCGKHDDDMRDTISGDSNAKRAEKILQAVAKSQLPAWIGLVTKVLSHNLGKLYDIFADVP